MKTIFLSLVFVIVACIFVDRELYFYGKSFIKHYSPFHIEIKPDYWGANLGNLGFVLTDEYGMTILNSGSKHDEYELTVKSMLEYGFDQNRFFVIVSDSSNSKYLISIDKTTQQDLLIITSIQPFKKDVIINFNKLNWVKTDNIYDDTFVLVLFREILMLVFIILSIFILRGLTSSRG